MTPAELEKRYGPTIARRLVHELTPAEMKLVMTGDALLYLQIRADNARRSYDGALMEDGIADETMLSLRSLWQEAEDLAYLVRAAEEAQKAQKASRGRA